MPRMQRIILKEKLRGRAMVHSKAGDEKRRCLLAEFLEKKFACRLAINAQAETSSQDSETEVRSIPDDLLFKIFILLPAESLFRLQFVCKKWFNLINSSVIIRFHVQQSQTVLISLNMTLLEPGFYASLNPHSTQESQHKFKSYFHFLDLNNENDEFTESSVVELVDIRASCDDLVLATMVKKNKSLILMNPVTRKHTVLPSGTVANSSEESYGVAFCNESNTYKVVHLFRKEQGQTGCEILNICTRKWARIEGPPPCPDLLRFIRQILVSIGGSLYWLPGRHSCDHFICLSVHHEKFVTKALPAITGMKDRLVEIGGSLGFVAQTEVDLLQVWILVDRGSEVNWEKRYNIDLHSDDKYLIPICSSRKGKEMVLESPFHNFYIYDFDRDECGRSIQEMTIKNGLNGQTGSTFLIRTRLYRGKGRHRKVLC